MNGPDDQSGPKSDACFTTTHWSAVLAAGQQDSPQATAALEALCRSYWYPLPFPGVRDRQIAKSPERRLVRAPPTLAC